MLLIPDNVQLVSAKDTKAKAKTAQYRKYISKLSSESEVEESYATSDSTSSEQAWPNVGEHEEAPEDPLLRSRDTDFDFNPESEKGLARKIAYAKAQIDALDVPYGPDYHYEDAMMSRSASAVNRSFMQPRDVNPFGMS